MVKSLRYCTTSNCTFFLARLRAVILDLSSALMLAPSSIKHWTIFNCPSDDAKWRAVHPDLFFAFTSAPFSMRYFTIFKCPSPDAKWIADWSIVSVALTSALFSIRYLTISKCPCSAAMWIRHFSFFLSYWFGDDPVSMRQITSFIRPSFVALTMSRVPVNIVQPHFEQKSKSKIFRSG